jgi:hypothetical protein
MASLLDCAALEAGEREKEREGECFRDGGRESKGRKGRKESGKMTWIQS